MLDFSEEHKLAAQLIRNWCSTRLGPATAELEEGKTTPYSRNALRITGKLALNATDPERFLFVIGNAKVKEME